MLFCAKNCKNERVGAFFWCRAQYYRGGKRERAKRYNNAHVKRPKIQKRASKNGKLGAFLSLFGLFGVTAAVFSNLSIFLESR